MVECFVFLRPLGLRLPIDARRSPTAVNNLAMNRSFEWFENNVIYRVPSNFPGVGRRVYPGFLQHTGFVAMNPDRHLSSLSRIVAKSFCEPRSW